MLSAASSHRLKIDIVVASGISVPRSLLRQMEQAALAAYAHLPKRLQIPATVTLLLTGNAAVRRLNHDFRGKDKPTNVLSFPQFEPRQITKMGKTKAPINLGDIAISYPYIVDEAKNTHKILINHATHLMIHGLLHLLGYDHISENDATRMERLETKIMAALGLPDPYLPVQLKEPKPAKTAGKKRSAVGHRG